MKKAWKFFLKLVVHPFLDGFTALGEMVAQPFNSMIDAALGAYGDEEAEASTEKKPGI